MQKRPHQIQITFWLCQAGNVIFIEMTASQGPGRGWKLVWWQPRGSGVPASCPRCPGWSRGCWRIDPHPPIHLEGAVLRLRVIKKALFVHLTPQFVCLMFNVYITLVRHLRNLKLNVKFRYLKSKIQLRRMQNIICYGKLWICFVFSVVRTYPGGQNYCLQWSCCCRDE